MYKAIVRFKDLQNSQMYEVGDEFPHDGTKVSAERIAELMSDKNKSRRPLIEEVEDESNDDGIVSGAEELVRQRSSKVSRKSRDKRRNDVVS